MNPMTHETPVPGGIFTILRPGRKVSLTREFRRCMGFTRGEILHLVSTIDRAARDGGSYRIRRLDGPADSLDLEHDLHRSTFVPESNAMLERRARREAKAAKLAAKETVR